MHALDEEIVRWTANILLYALDTPPHAVYKTVVVIIIMIIMIVIIMIIIIIITPQRMHFFSI